MTAPLAYHGTRRGFQRGGLLVPRAEHGGAATTAPVMPGCEVPDHASGWVYFTGSLDLAWAYAFRAVGRARPRVLVIRPAGEVHRDPEHSADMDAWRCEWATVAAVLLDPPDTEENYERGWVVRA